MKIKMVHADNTDELFQELGKLTKHKILTMS